ncbi:SUMF1/EgtB/PvdO family nonheme iron enzyme [Elusimicrobiota bacterium]
MKKSLLVFPPMIGLLFIAGVAWAIFCPQCGKESPDDAKFCIKCGKRLPVERTDGKAADEAALVHEQAHKLIDMSPIPAGKFWMGSAKGKGPRVERPRHEVYLDAFYIDKYEVTNSKYAECIKKGACKKPSAWYICATGWSKYPSNWPTGGNNHPAVCVDWKAATSYCEWIGKRLPTEAEWEKAARGGTDTQYSFGDSKDDLGDYAWYDKNSDSKAHPVGQKKPNPYGLYDMHGNVFEWVADGYKRGYYKDSPKKNPTGPAKKRFPVYRGGSWADPAHEARSPARSRRTKVWQSSAFGFRCAVSAP